MNKILLNISFVVTLSFAAILYAIANFSHPRIDNPTVKNIIYLVIVSSSWALLEYCIKIPAYHLFGLKLYSQITLQMFWLILTTISVILLEKYYLKKNIPNSTYLIVTIIVLLLVIENNLRYL